jgi:hypothetical protein
LKEIPYIGLAERLGVGRFYQTGDQVIELNRTGPAEPWSRTGRVQELARHIVDRDACSACYGSLIHALARLREQGSLARFQTKIRIGQGYRGQTSPDIGIGSCTRGCAAHLEGCPPTAKAMVDFLEKHGETKNLGQKS